MTCLKCGGLVVDEYGDRHCLNCGWAGGEVRRADLDVDEEAARVIERLQALRAPVSRPAPIKEKKMGKWSDATREAFKLKLRAARARKRGATVGETAPVSKAVPAVIRERPARIIECEAVTPVDLEQAIERTREDLQILERAKSILGRLGEP